MEARPEMLHAAFHASYVKAEMRIQRPLVVANFEQLTTVMKSQLIVMLAGSVPDRHMKRELEDCVEAISGVRDVQNRIRVGGSPAASPAAAGDPEREERENIGSVSRFWRSGN